MTIEEFEKLAEQQLSLEEIEANNYAVGIEKFKGKECEYNFYLVTEEKSTTGTHIEPLKAILKAIFQL
jgi:hypothetical protein